MTPKEGRKFAFTVGIAFLVFMGISIWRGHETVPIVLGTLGGVLLLAGLIVPGKLGPVYKAWMGLALLISKVTTPIFMGIVYFIAFLPIGTFIRASGKNPMKHKPEHGSFWFARPEGAKRRSDLQRQF